MKEALKNPNYKKIWEAVIKNRHPEKESLEEALKNESSFGDCRILLDDIYSISNDCVIYDFMKPHIARHISFFEEESIDATCKDCDSKRISIDDVVYKATITKYNNPQILGRPITLADIFRLLHKEINLNPYVVYRERESDIALITLIMECTTEQMISQNGLKANILFVWHLDKDIHEQTPETWEEIANLID